MHAKRIARLLHGFVMWRQFASSVGGVLFGFFVVSLPAGANQPSGEVARGQQPAAEVVLAEDTSNKDRDASDLSLTSVPMSPRELRSLFSFDPKEFAVVEKPERTPTANSATGGPSPIRKRPSNNPPGLPRERTLQWQPPTAGQPTEPSAATSPSAPATAEQGASGKFQGHVTKDQGQVEEQEEKEGKPSPQVVTDETDKGEETAKKTISQAVEGKSAQPTKAAAPKQPTPPAVVLKPLTRNQLYLRNRLRHVLAYYKRRPLNSRDNDCWETMHGMLAYGLTSRIREGGPQGKLVTAIGWLCYNRPCQGKQLLTLNDRGEIHARYGVGLEGHSGQFLAMLAQCNVDRNYPIHVEGQEFTIQDLIAAEQKTCYGGTELTFKLIGLMHYLPSDSQWLNDRGESWSIERLVAEELEQPIRGVACGGTHRLGGLSLAVKRRLTRGEPLDGVYQQAAERTQQYEKYAYQLQNRDGSFSTEWFRGPGDERDINRKVRTTGHLLEWVLYQVPDEQLASYRVVKAVHFLTTLLAENSRNEWEIGPLAHALHALALYDQRMFQPHDLPPQVSKRETSTSSAASSDREPH